MERQKDRGRTLTSLKIYSHGQAACPYSLCFATACVWCACSPATRSPHSGEHASSQVGSHWSVGADPTCHPERVPAMAACTEQGLCTLAVWPGLSQSPAPCCLDFFSQTGLRKLDISTEDSSYPSPSRTLPHLGVTEGRKGTPKSLPISRTPQPM